MAPPTCPQPAASNGASCSCFLLQLQLPAIALHSVRLCCTQHASLTGAFLNAPRKHKGKALVLLVSPRPRVSSYAKAPMVVAPCMGFT